MRTHLFASLSLALVGLGAFACHSSTPPATTTPDQPGACPTGQFCPPPTPTTVPTNTAPAPTASASSGSTATPAPPLAALAIAPVMQGMAATEAPGMKADSQPFAGQFQEGQTLEQPFNIQPGKCYTVLGASAGGIVELDLQIVFQAAPLPPAVLAQDNTTGPTAVVGGKANGCWRNPTPLGAPGKVVLKATKGAGIAAAQIFVK